MELTAKKVNNFIEGLIPPIKSIITILSVTPHEKYSYFLYNQNRTGEPAGFGALQVFNGIFTGKQFFAYFGGYSPKTAEGKMYLRVRIIVESQKQVFLWKKQPGE